MELNAKNIGVTSSTKEPQPNRSKISKNSKLSENFNPNVTSPVLMFPNSTGTKAVTKSQRSASKNPSPIASPSPRNKIRERRFVVAKKNLKKEKLNSSMVRCKCKSKLGGKSQKCVCVAYDSLRSSQEEFFETRDGVCEADTRVGVEDENSMVQNPEIPNGCGEKPKEVDCFATIGMGDHDTDEIKLLNQMGSLTIKRRRDKLLEEEREAVPPEPRSGKVMHLVKAFESLFSIPDSKNSDQKHGEQLEDKSKVVEGALQGRRPMVAETQAFSTSPCQSDFFLTLESLGLSSSSDGSQGSGLRRTSRGGQRSRRNSSESSETFAGRNWKRKQHKVTCQTPFKLRTEQRGRCKEEEFIKKVQQMMMEEQRQRIPIAQGLPWTTDEPECLVKCPVKENTRPIDLSMHSDIRALERAKFDHQVAEKMILIEHYRMERERQQKLAEEEEIRSLRKELIPRAQPMPYFDRPFMPTRSLKHPTGP